MIAMYLRKSRAEELTETAAEVLERHRAYLLAYAERQNMRIDDTYQEVVSGESIAARPEMLRLLSAVEAGRYEAVLCMDIDRLGRGGMQDQGRIIDVFRATGTLIITPDHTYDLTSESDEQLTELKSFISRAEYKIITKRLRRGLQQTIERGGYVPNAPYGYKKTVVTRLPTLEIVPEEAVFVRYAYERYAEGVGAATIAEELRAMGSVPRRNGRWERSSVRVMLRNPTYKGYVAWGRVRHRRTPDGSGGIAHHVTYLPEDQWLMVPGLHEAIIEPELWDRVQEIRISRHIPSHKVRGVTANSLAGLVICGVCGRKMQRMGSNKGCAYLLCTTRACCAATKMAYVEEAVVTALATRLAQLRTEAAAAEAPDISTQEAALAALDAQQAKLEHRKLRLYELLEDGTYDRTTYRTRMDALEAQLAALGDQRRKLEDEVTAITAVDLSAAADSVASVLDAWPTADAGQRNLLLKGILTSITYRKPKGSGQKSFSLAITAKNFTW